MKNFYALFNTFLCIGIDIGIGRLCNCHIGIGIGIGRYENQIYRWLSVSADMKKCLSVAHYPTLPKSQTMNPPELSKNLEPRTHKLGSTQH